MRMPVITHSRKNWLIITILYFLLVAAISGFFTTAYFAIQYSSTIDWIFFLFGPAITLVNAALLSSSLLYVLGRKNASIPACSLSAGGAFAGLLFGVCPICVAGVLPLFLEAIGVGIFWKAFPLQGIELQFILLLVLATQNIYLRRSYEKNQS